MKNKNLTKSLILLLLISKQIPVLANTPEPAITANGQVMQEPITTEQNQQKLELKEEEHLIRDALIGVLSVAALTGIGLFLVLDTIIEYDNEQSRKCRH